MMPHGHKTLMGGGCPTRRGLIFLFSPTFQGKSEVEASKHGEVSSQARKVPTSIRGILK
jgi:hypothetical protein